MLVLLPPSESKARPARRGPPVDLDALSFPGLRTVRDELLAALIATSTLPDAAARLGAGGSLAHEVQRNARLRELPAAPALTVYTGVLYDALGWDSLDTSARRRGQRRLLVVSALWGALRPVDRVPPYRMPMTAELPGVGPLARRWRPGLTDAIAAAAGDRGVIVDCRSGPYVAAAPPAGPLAARTVAVRVLREDAAGGRSVVSHLAKHTRGEVARHLLETGADPRTPRALANAVGDRWPVELVPPRPGAGWTLDVVLRGR